MANVDNVDTHGPATVDDNAKLMVFVQAAYEACEDCRFDDAERYADQALSVDPSNSDALYIMALCSNICGDSDPKGYRERAERHREDSLGIMTQGTFERLLSTCVVDVIGGIHGQTVDIAIGDAAFFTDISRKHRSRGCQRIPAGEYDVSVVSSDSRDLLMTKKLLLSGRSTIELGMTPRGTQFLKVHE